MRNATESVGYLSAVLQQMSYAGLVVAGSLLVMQGHMTMGALIACSILSGRILAPVMALPGLLVQHSHASAALEGLERLYTLESDNHGIAHPLVPTHIKGHYQLADVEFAYGQNPPVIGVPKLEIKPAMTRTGMDRIVGSHPKGLERPIMEGGKGLSNGQKQLVAFTRLILCKPDILLLDEPTATMDDMQERQCMAVLAEEANAGKTLVIVTHKPGTLSLVNRIIVVAGSAIVMDGPRDAVLQQLQQRPNAQAAS